jgi:hypothetical protein
VQVLAKAPVEADRTVEEIVSHIGRNVAMSVKRVQEFESLDGYVTDNPDDHGRRVVH